jgi:hypothetical protein
MNHEFGPYRAPDQHGTTVHHTRTAIAFLAAQLMLLCSLLSVQASAAESSIFHGLLDLRFSNAYITPRGLIVEDEGLVFQPLFLLFADLYQSNGPLSSVTASVGIWNSMHSHVPEGVNSSTDNWNEMDFLSGLAFTFYRDWTFGVSYQYWVSPIDAFASASILDMTFSYSDHFLERVMTGKWSLNPYVRLFIELHNKATVSSTDESYYIELGIGPKYVFDGYPLTLELPTYVTFPGHDFYSESSTLGLVGTGLKVTAPLTSIPERYGKWSLYAGFRYYHFFNDGIVAGNRLLPPGSTNRDPLQAIGGVALAF